VRSERARQRLVDVYSTAPFGADEADRSLVYSERCERLNRALAELPYEQREVVVLKVKNGLKLKDIARLQNVSISTVHGRYRYGMDKLRTLLNGEI
jgi:RNA polymerase sigma-70 factor (ECF subfamily)